MSLPHYRRPGQLWYVSDGLIWDRFPASCRQEPGRPLECSSQVLILNPQRRAAKVTARFYHTDRPPTAVPLTVAPGRVESLELASLGEVPHNQSFWIVVEANVPVLPQARHEDYTFWDPVPDALISVAPYPGPLEHETSWVFPDCYESDPRGPWYERETLTILNPNKAPVTTRVRYLPRYYDLGGEEEIEIPAERVAQLNVWERTPHLLGNEKGAPVHVIGDYAVRIDASAPVIAQTTRRARWTGYDSIIGARSVMGFPLRGRGHDLWYYPGGAVVDRGVLPRAKDSDHPLSQCDNTWNLLFINNLDEKRDARATVTCHRPDGTSTDSRPLMVPPLKSDLQCLHAKPWLGVQTRVDEPFALTVAANRPVVPEVTCAEFELWSRVMPGAMSAVNLYPGPLRGERTWWLGLGEAGGADEINREWLQTYHLFNPARRRATITLSFLGLRRRGRPITRTVEVPAGAVVRLESTEIDALPIGQLFAVRADGDRPFCAQVFVRAFTRGLVQTRAMYSLMGVPMALGC